MNESSVTGRKWILKKFDLNDANFIKDNFFLDEVTSKLLAIKMVKKEKISNFLNPTIKNILPNPNILKDMEKSVQRTIQAIDKKETIGRGGISGKK